MQDGLLTERLQKEIRNGLQEHSKSREEPEEGRKSSRQPRWGSRGSDGRPRRGRRRSRSIAKYKQEEEAARKA
jgi:hypothetical protein